MTRDEFDRQFVAIVADIDTYYRCKYQKQYDRDLLQETFTSALEHYQSWNPARCNIKTWIISILKNKIKTSLKYNRLHPSQTEQAYIPDGECHLYIDHDERIIHHELCKLTFHQRRVVICLMKGIKTGEMGRCFPKITNPKNYKSAVKYVRNEIKNRLILTEAV